MNTPSTSMFEPGEPSGYGIKALESNRLCSAVNLLRGRLAPRTGEMSQKWHLLPEEIERKRSLKIFGYPIVTCQDVLKALPPNTSSPEKIYQIDEGSTLEPLSSLMTIKQVHCTVEKEFRQINDCLCTPPQRDLPPHQRRVEMAITLNPKNI